MKNHLVILGNGGHARVVSSIWEKDYREITFITQNEQNHFFETFDFASADCFIAIGDNNIRKELFKKLIAKKARLPNCIAPNTYIASNVIIGSGCFVGFGVNVLTGSVLGSNIIINTASTVDHDCIIEDHVQITAGVTLGGTTTISEGSFLGVKVATLPLVKIGKNCQIMAGSVVTKDTEENSVWGGYPAKMLKKTED